MRKADFKPATGEGAGPTPILSLEGVKRQCFAATPYPTQDGALAIDEDGRVWAWGVNLENRWGRPVGEGGAFSPGRFPSPYMLDVEGVALSSNEFSTDVVKADGTVITTKTGGTGQSSAGIGGPFVALSGISGVVAATSNRSIANLGAMYYLKNDGTVWGRGNRMPGMGGSTYADPVQFSTTQTGTDVEEIDATITTLAFRKATGAVKVWIGGGATTSEATPREPASIPSGAAKIAAGTSHVALLTDSGEIWVTGDNDNGQFGNGTTSTHNDWATWQKTDGTGYTDVASAADNLVAIKDGALWTWGQSSSRLGLGETPNLTDKLVPTEITDPAHDDYVSVHGYNLAPVFVAVRENGCMMIWGANTLGYLGRGYYGGVADHPVEVLTSQAHPPWPEA